MNLHLNFQGKLAFLWNSVLPLGEGPYGIQQSLH